MSMELITQVTAMVGTSILLFLITSPKGRPAEYVQDDMLGGFRKYSSYHRKIYYASQSA